MIKFYCQKARPIYVRTDDIWMTPSSKTAAGYVYVFTPDGYKDNASLVTTPTSLAADATLEQVVAAYNNLLTKLQTAGILVDNGSSNN